MFLTLPYLHMKKTRINYLLALVTNKLTQACSELDSVCDVIFDTHLLIMSSKAKC